MNKSMEGAFGLDGQVALVTGGGTGLGFAMAKCLIAAGARVIISGRHEKSLQRACSELGELASYIVWDVTITEQAPEVVKDIVKKYGKIDILINNAGIHCKKKIEQVKISEFQDVLNVHLLGRYALTQAVLPYMEKQNHGSIIFISSMSAVIGLTEVTAYGAAKGAVLALVKTISGEVAFKGIRVNAIVPGFIDSPMFRKATEKDPLRQQKILGHTQMGIYGNAEDIGWAAVYLCGNCAKFITGTTLIVDGGCSVGF